MIKNPGSFPYKSEIYTARNSAENLSSLEHYVVRYKDGEYEVASSSPVVYSTGVRELKPISLSLSMDEWKPTRVEDEQGNCILIRLDNLEMATGVNYILYGRVIDERGKEWIYYLNWAEGKWHCPDLLGYLVFLGKNWYIKVEIEEDEDTE